MNTIIKYTVRSIPFVLMTLVMAVMATPNAALAYNGYAPYSYGNDGYSQYSGYVYSAPSTFSYSSSYIAPAPLPPPIYVPQPVQVPVQVPVYYPVPTYVPQYVPVPTYVPTYVQTYPQLNVSCSANATNIQLGQTITWTAYASGSNGYYDYTWSGTDGFGGSGRSVSVTYNTPGVKYASVSLYSNGQRITQSCNNTVNVIAQIYQPVYQQPQQVVVPVYANKLDVGCFADPTSGRIDQPVTWNVEVSGGVQPYRYSWTGTDNLSGYSDSVLKWYSRTGQKYAVVTVTSADGRTITKACSNGVTIKATAVAAAKPKPVATPTPVCACNPPIQTTQTTIYPQSQTGDTSAPVVQLQNLPATSYLSLDNVPWGWVSLLVVLVLFATVLYLLFNRTKI